MSLALAAVPAAATDYALLVGVGSFDENYLADVSLNGTSSDITTMRTLLASDLNDWDVTSATVLENAKAPKGDPAILPLDSEGQLDTSIPGLGIRSWLAYYADLLVEGDTLLFYFSGHGGNYSDTTGDTPLGKSVFLSAYDANYSDAELAADLAAFKPGVRVLVVVDANFSGGLPPNEETSPRPAISAAVSAVLDNTAPDHAQIGWITSTSYDSTTSGAFTGSAFTTLFVNGALNFFADTPPFGNDDGYADAREAYLYAASSLDSDPQIANASVCAQFLLASDSATFSRVELRGSLAPTHASPEIYDCVAVYVDADGDDVRETILPASAVSTWGIDPASAGTFANGVLTLSSSAANGDVITLSASGTLSGEDWTATLVVTVSAPDMTYAEALDNSMVVWNPESWNGGTAWFGQSGTSYDDEDALQSSSIPAGGSSVFSGTFNGRGIFAFRYRVSATASDGLVVTIDGDEVLRAVGSVDWTLAQVLVGPGDHTAVFSYIRESTAPEADLGRAWVDQVAFTPVAYAFDMDDNDNGWTTGGFTNIWERGVPAFGPTDGRICWGTDLDSRYAANADCWLMSPPLAAEAGSVLAFRTWFDIDNTAWQDYYEATGSEFDNGWKTYLDAGFVEISINNGGWRNISSSLICPGNTSEKTVAGTSSGWVAASTPLPDDAAGQSVRIRFRFASDAYVAAGQPGSPAGWFIDDVALYSPADQDIVLVRTAVEDTATGNANGIVEPGESVWVSFEIANQGDDPISGLVGSVQCNTPGVTLPAASSAVTYGDLDSGVHATGIPRLLVSIADTVVPGTLVRLVQTIRDADGSSWDVESAFRVSAAATLSGTVYEVRALSDGTTEDVPLAGAIVEASGSTVALASAGTGATGAYSFPDFPAGTYRVSASAPGLAPAAARTVTIPGESVDFRLGKAYALLSDTAFSFALENTSDSPEEGSFTISNVSRADGLSGTIPTSFTIQYPEGRPAWLTVDVSEGTILPGASRSIAFSISASRVISDPRTHAVIRVSSNDCEGFAVQDIEIDISFEGVTNPSEYLSIAAFEGTTFPYHTGDSDGYLERGEIGALAFTVANDAYVDFSDLVVTAFEVVGASDGADVSDISLLYDLAEVLPSVSYLPAGGSCAVSPALEVSLADPGVPDPVYTISVTLENALDGTTVTLQGDWAAYDRYSVTGAVYTVSSLSSGTPDPDAEPVVETNSVLRTTVYTAPEGETLDVDNLPADPDEGYPVTEIIDPASFPGYDDYFDAEGNPVPKVEVETGVIIVQQQAIDEQTGLFLIDDDTGMFIWEDVYVPVTNKVTVTEILLVPVVPVTNVVLTITTTTTTSDHILFANPDDPTDLSNLPDDTHTEPVAEDGGELLVSTREETIPLDDYYEDDYPDAHYVAADDNHGLVVEIIVTEFARFEEEGDDPGPQPDPIVRTPVPEAHVFGVGPDFLVETVTREDGTYVLHGLRNGYAKLYATRTAESTLTGMSKPVAFSDLAADLPDDVYFAALDADPIAVTGVNLLGLAASLGASAPSEIATGLDFYIPTVDNALLEVSDFTVEDANRNGVIEMGEEFLLSLEIANRGIGMAHNFSVSVEPIVSLDGGSFATFTPAPSESDTFVQDTDEDGNPIVDDDGNPVYLDLQFSPGYYLVNDALNHSLQAGDEAGRLPVSVRIVDWRYDLATGAWVESGVWYSTFDLEVSDFGLITGTVSLDGTPLPTTFADGTAFDTARVYLDHYAADDTAMENVLSTEVAITDASGGYQFMLHGDYEDRYVVRVGKVTGALSPDPYTDIVPADLWDEADKTLVYDFDYTGLGSLSITPNPLEIEHAEGESTTAALVVDNQSGYDITVDSVAVRYTRTAADMGAVSRARVARAAAAVDADTGAETLDPEQDVPGELFVTFFDNVSPADQNALLASLGLEVAGRFRLVRSVLCRFDEAAVSYESLRAALLASGLVWRVDTNRRIRIEPAALADYVSVTDPRADEQWAIFNERQTGGTFGADINALPLWTAGLTGSRDVIVAVHDSGVDLTHPDLVPNLWVNEAELNGEPGVDDDDNGYIDDVHGWNFSDDSNDPSDENGHGTHVAGIIGAAANAVGTLGVNWNVTILPVRVANADGGIDTTVENMVRSFEYMLDCGVSVCNCSWGSSYLSESPIVASAVRAACDVGLLVVVAAGNDAINNDTHIGAIGGIQADNMIVVAAADHNGKIAEFSNWGANSVHIAAPGVDILSTVPGGYESMSGTSMATPYVTGAAALLLSAAPDTPTPLIRQAILRGARVDESLRGWVSTSGHLDVAGAFALLGDDWLVPATAFPVDVANGASATIDFDVNPGLSLSVGVYEAFADITYTVDGESHTLSVPVTDTVGGAASLSVVSVVIDDSAAGDGDGFAEPGETVGLIVTLRNTGASVMTDAIGSVEGASASFPDLSPGAAGANAAPIAVAIPAAAFGTYVVDLEVAGTFGGSDVTRTIPVSISVRPAASVVGTVRNSSGRGVANAVVEFWTSGTPAPSGEMEDDLGYVAAGRVTTDATGAYRIDGLAAEATAYLRAIPDGYARSYISIASFDASDTATVNITVRPGAVWYQGLDGDLSIERTVRLNGSATASFTVMNASTTDLFLKAVFVERKSVLLVSDGEALNAVAPALRDLGFDVDVLDHNYECVNVNYGANQFQNEEHIFYTDDVARFMRYDFVIIDLGGVNAVGRQLTTAERNAVQQYLDIGGRVLFTAGNLFSRPDDAVLSGLFGDASMDRLDATAYPVVADALSLPYWRLLNITDTSFSGISGIFGISYGEPVALPGGPFAYDVAAPALPFQSYATAAQDAAQKLYRFDSGNGALWCWTGNPDGADIVQRGIWQDILRDILVSELFVPVDWVSASPGAFGIAASRSTSCTLAFDASDLDAGDYEATLLFFGELSDAETSAIHVTLHVRRPLFTAYSNTGVTNAFGAYLKGDGMPGSFVYQLILTPDGTVSAPDATGLPADGETVVASSTTGQYFGRFGSDGATVDLGQFSERYEIPNDGTPVYAVVRAWTGSAPGKGAFWGDSEPYAVQFVDGESHNFGTWGAGTLFQVDGSLPLDSNGDGVPDAYVIEHFPGSDPAADLVVEPDAECLQEIKGSSTFVPYRVFATDRYVYALNNNQKRVDVWTTAGINGTFIGSFRPTGAIQFTDPVGMGRQPGAFRLAVADAGRHVVQVFDFNENAIAAASGQDLSAAFTHVLTIGTPDTPFGRKNESGVDGLFTAAQGVAMDASGAVYVADTGRLNGESDRRILVFNADGSQRSVLQPTGNATLVDPAGLDIDPASGDIYVANTGAGSIVRLSASGSTLAVYTPGQEVVTEVPITETVQTTHYNIIERPVGDGVVVTTNGSYTVTEVVTNGFETVTNVVHDLVGPTDVKVWTVGSTFRLLVADRDGNAIHILDSNGKLVATFSNPIANADTYNRVGNFRKPWGVYPIDETAEAWVADTRNNRLQHLRLTVDGDGDGIDDTVEMQNGLDPTTPDEADTDGDGITDAMELALSYLDNRSGSETFGTNTHTDIDNADSDGDGLTDFEEVNGGTNPLDPEDAADTLCTVTVTAQLPEGGTVSGAGQYPAGSTATLTATAAEGWQFAGWQDGETAATRDIRVGLYDNDYIALFERQTYLVVVNYVTTNETASAIVPGGTETFERYYGIVFHRDRSGLFQDPYAFESGSDTLGNAYAAPVIDFAADSDLEDVDVTFVVLGGENVPLPDAPAITATAIAVENGKLSASFSTDATAVGQLWTFIDETTGAATLIVADTLDHLAAYRDSGATDGIDTIAVTAVVDEATLGFSIADVDVSAYDALFIIGFEAP